MLQGFTVPRTPLGRAAATPPPPWHYASDIVGVEYWADPKATAALLPPGLAADPRRTNRRLRFSNTRIERIPS